MQFELASKSSTPSFPSLLFPLSHDFHSNMLQLARSAGGSWIEHETLILFLHIMKTFSSEFVIKKHMLWIERASWCICVSCLSNCERFVLYGSARMSSQMSSSEFHCVSLKLFSAKSLRDKFLCPTLPMVAWRSHSLMLFYTIPRRWPSSNCVFNRLMDHGVLFCCHNRLRIVNFSRINNRRLEMFFIRQSSSNDLDEGNL